MTKLDSFTTTLGTEEVYRLVATQPVRVTSPAAVAFEFYAPENRSSSQPATLTFEAAR